MSEVSVLEGAGSIRRTRMKNANQVTGANSGESRLLPMRARCAARVAQFWRSERFGRLAFGLSQE